MTHNSTQGLKNRALKLPKGPVTTLSKLNGVPLIWTSLKWYHKSNFILSCVEAKIDSVFFAKEVQICTMSPKPGKWGMACNSHLLEVMAGKVIFFYSWRQRWCWFMSVQPAKHGFHLFSCKGIQFPRLLPRKHKPLYSKQSQVNVRMENSWEYISIYRRFLTNYSASLLREQLFLHEEVSTYETLLS